MAPSYGQQNEKLNTNIKKKNLEDIKVRERMNGMPMLSRK